MARRGKRRDRKVGEREEGREREREVERNGEEFIKYVMDIRIASRANI